MKILKDYGKINPLIEQIRIEKVYPLSIFEEIQKGEIFVDNDEAPTVALIWHYCGFANIIGNYNEEFVEETMNMMLNPPDGHSGRMALQTETDIHLHGLITKATQVSRHERYIFEFSEEKTDLHNTVDSELETISSNNYELIKGRITPTFSWANKESFLKNGFGYCLIADSQMLACAFASGVSNDYVDIGVETTEECRGKGYGRIVASAMVKEIIRRGKTPSWACDTRNEASRRLACSIGFETVGTHPWYTCEK